MRPAFSFLTLLSLLLLPLGVLHAEDDEAAADSPAEALYRDAWWAETSTGRLDEAIRGYERAAGAEGPDAVRARALLRLGVVLERIGRTEEAIRTLERLAETHPDQTEVQAEARERLEAWTAVDVRKDYEAWYRQYQYGPEFQARILDLVLALSDTAQPKSERVSTAEQELLTIGEAAIPALRAHLDSANEKLRERAVSLLMQLGAVPPARLLVETWEWQRVKGAWTLLLDLPREQAEPLRAELEAVPGPTAAVLAELLAGREAWPRALHRLASVRLFDAFPISEAEPGLVAGLKALVGRFEGREAGMNGFVAAGLHDRGVVTAADAQAWLRNGPDDVRRQVLRWLDAGEYAEPATVEAVVDTMRAAPLDPGMPGALMSSLVAVLSNTDASLDLGPAVRAIEQMRRIGRWPLPGAQRALGTTDTGPDPAAARRLLAAIVETTTDEQLAKDALDAWQRFAAADPRASFQMLAFLTRPAGPDLRQRLATLAGELASAESLAPVLDAADSEDEIVAAYVLKGLGDDKGLLGLPWTDERMRRVLAGVCAPEATLRGKAWGRLLTALYQDRARRDQVVRLALADPEGLDARTFRLLPSPWSAYPDVHAAAREGLPERWPAWSPAQRLAALGVFGPLLSTLGADDPLVAFLRGALGDVEPGPVAVAILDLLPATTLDDLRRAYDLSDPVQALAAAKGEIPRTPEVYEALAAARRADDEQLRHGFYGRWLEVPSVRAQVHRDMASDPSPALRRLALIDLGNLRDPQDVPRFRDALADPDAAVRAAAANALAQVYDPAAIQALVKTLDDPSPQVRDAVLQTLEAIRKIEEQKAFWRERTMEDAVRDR